MVVLKNSREIVKMSEAGRISARALKSAEKCMQVGVSTMEINNEIHKEIKACGAVPSFLGLYGFPASACISLNEHVIHGIPSKDVILKDGDIVSVDVGACYDEFHGDNAFTYRVGNITDEVEQLLKVTQESLYLGIEQAKLGNRIGDISHAIETHARSFGYGVVKEFLGHGIGKDVHEEPEIPNYGKPGHGSRLMKGMVIAIEPMINLIGDNIKQLSDGWTVVTASGSPSAHFEHTIVITDSGPRILTQV